MKKGQKEKKKMHDKNTNWSNTRHIQIKDSTTEISNKILKKPLSFSPGTGFLIHTHAVACEYCWWSIVNLFYSLYENENQFRWHKDQLTYGFVFQKESKHIDSKVGNTSIKHIY